jgi:C_GCAxxG_C_C family probable redox protein
MGKEEKAINYHRRNFNCSQAVLTVFGPDFGISEDACLKLACAFGGGMARKQHICGAVTGALMVLGLKYGMGLNDPEDKKIAVYNKSSEFFREFRKLNGSTVCRELLDDLDLNNDKDYRQLVDQNLFQIKCEKYMADAVKITQKLIK